jgi:hypothetical protein
LNLIVSQAVDRLPRSFRYVRVLKYSSGLGLLSFVHAEANIEFVLIPGGSYHKGLSRDEYQAASQFPDVRADILNGLPPAGEVEVAPFLISRTPLQMPLVKQYIALDRLLFRPEFGEDEQDPVPVYVTRGEALEFTARFGFALPTEIQMEYAIRGGTQTLFYFGSELPSEETLENEILVSKFDQETMSDVRKANGFGLVGSLVGCWCQDDFVENGVVRGYTTKGGGAIFWPWQDTGEWMLCMSAMRLSSKDLEDETCAAFVVASVE